MIRSSKHSIKFSNLNKIKRLDKFLNEYQRVGQLIIDNIWNNGYEKFSIQFDSLSFPKYIDYNKFNIQTTLSARAMSSLVTQICGILSASTEKRRRLLWLINKLKNENKDTSHLLNNISKYKLTKPNFVKQCELSSKCCDIKQGNSFDWFVSLKSIGKEFGKINMPIKGTKVSKKWSSKGKILGSFLISNKIIQIRFKIDDRKSNNTGKNIVGIDQGIKTVATLSDGQTTPIRDNHGYSLESIINKLSRKRKGSDAFQRTQEHRKNFINWSINKLNLQDAKEIRLEKIFNIGYKKRRSRMLSHWTNTLIRDKIKRRCEELEVPVIEQNSSYRSQRCSRCGNVRKSNRKGKIYSCKHCKNTMDADLNASLNHSIDLPEIGFEFRSQRNNLGNGFFWNPTGLFSYDGVEFRVPLSSNKNNFL